jgi:hypothetical protein
MLASLAALAVGLVLPVTLASASSPSPFRFEERVYALNVFATRVHLVVSAVSEGKVPFEWHAEYSTSRAVVEAGKGIAAGAGTCSASEAVEALTLGGGGGSCPGGGQAISVHRLTPVTTYYARFVAKASGEEIAKVVEFKTGAVAKPAIYFDGQIDGEKEGREGWIGPALTPTSAKVTSGDETLIESNGAATVYHFEYSLPEAGHAPPPGSASWKPFTSGAEGSISVAEDFVQGPQAALTGLTPETLYFFRVRAANEKGTAEVVRSATTPTAKAIAQPRPEVRNVTATSAHLVGSFDPGGSKAHGRLEYSTSPSGPWTAVPGAEVAVSQAEAEALLEAKAQGREYQVRVEARLSGLTAATAYYVRVFAENECAQFCGGTGGASSSFETSGAPVVSTFAVHGLHGESLRLLGDVNPHSVPTSAEQAIALQGSPTGGTFALEFNGHSTAVPVTGTVTSGSATITGIPLATVKGTGTVGTGFLNVVTGVVASVGRFHPGQAISGPGIAPGTHISGVKGTTLLLDSNATEKVASAVLTSSEPVTVAVGETLAGLGVPANATITKIEYPADNTATLTLSANATASASGVSLTAGIPHDASAGVVQGALQALPALSTIELPNVGVDGPAGGPYTVLFVNAMGGVSEPQIACVGSGLTPSGSGCAGSTTEPGGVFDDTHYHFEYVSQTQFETEGGWANATSTPTVDLGGGNSTVPVGSDLPALTGGETYRFRISATNTSPGNPVARGAEQTLRVPSAPAVGEPACANEAARTGASARLPDCRAYEQLTPVDKGAAQEIYQYGGTVGLEGALPSEDGNHLMYSSQFVKWGAGPTAGQGPYFFSRDPEKGWQVTAGAPQPEAGVSHYIPRVFDPGLTQVGVEASWQTSATGKSPTVEYKAGPPGGPYTTVASVPRGQVGGEQHAGSSGWVAASADFSKLILAVEDRKLSEPHSSTQSGLDLYEYSAGVLRQVNVEASGETVKTIGTCGAVIAHGAEGAGGTASSRDAVSADGSRVFFEAVPSGQSCSEPTHLYARVGGAGTSDLGAYRFAAADAQGTHLLLEKKTGGNPGLYTFDSGSGAPPRLLAGSALAAGAAKLLVSEDLSTAYVLAGGGGDLYRYDVHGETLGFLAHLDSPASLSTSPDGRYLYFQAKAVAGLPGGGQWLRAPHTGSNESGQTAQAYRYDSSEQLVQCVSCASPHDPEPRMSAWFAGSGAEGVLQPAQGVPSPRTIASANGDYVFFQTPAALVPSDVDGEIPPEIDVGSEAEAREGVEHGSTVFSLSSDVYEWRRPGVDGCGHPQGCLALITSGHGGYLNILLGASEDGHDVFFTTASQLSARDNDTALDIYDARIGGGFPEPPHPVECEGDACSTPFAPPTDLTPASSTFQGAGNVLGGWGLNPPMSAPAPKPRPKAK